ncbi:MAG TPA: glycosyltransferase family A protein [Terriglobales bacterium]|nr:glycosyltransferase family A protein [Terriglobales bacterium]
MASMNSPLVSVAMVVCNVDRFLSQAIDSVLNQTLRDLEFVIVDFGSEDRSKAIVSGYAAKDSRIKFHEIPHCGLAEARNAACFLCKTDYIAIMDADDIAVEERLQWQMEFMLKSPDVGVVGGGVQWIDVQGMALRNAYNPCDDAEIQAQLLYGCPFWQPTVLMRREAFVQVGGYRDAFAPAEDYDLWLRIAEQYKMANLSKILLRYRMHPGQVSVRKREQQTFGHLAAQVSASRRRSGNPDPLSLVKEITPALLQQLGIDEPTIEKKLATEYVIWMRHLFLATEYSSALDVSSKVLQSSNWIHARKIIVDVRLMNAHIYWKQKKFLKSLTCVCGAFVRRPLIAGRPLRAILRLLQS